jgi:predicted transcriptional regulator
MVDEGRPSISDAERGVLNILWDEGPGGVRDVHRLTTERGFEWTRSTVITLLQRLEKKGYVTSDRSNHAFVYRACISREDEMHARMNDLAGELCAGDAVPLVLAFAERHRFTPEQIEQFKQMIAQMEAKPKKRGQS